jgi:RimJ/RimL family protein N-acetyltransferase
MEPAHLEGLQTLNSDPVVMRYITGQPETRDGTIAMIQRVQARWAEFGHSWWSFIRHDNGDLIGCGCVQHLARNPENPLELGWRLRQDSWGQGYASEAARHMARFGFGVIGAPLLCAVCHPDNTPSSTVMERLGMGYVGMGHWYDMDLKRYDMSAEAWAGSAAKAKADAEAHTPPMK